jgi:F0F1-type ATP synthase membrane subunit c/vacuolar-type H+-ATPase subunit K
MTARRILEWAGLAAGIVLIVFGIGALYMGIDGRNTVRDSIKQEQIFFGEATDPAVAEHAEQWAGEQVLDGDQARAFALIMREHTLESTDGLTYAEMGRFQSAADPGDPAGTSDEAAAAKDESGEPIANGARNIWVTETGLTTALNMSYMAEQLSVFGIVVGIALLLTGIGLMILALAVLGGRFREEAAAQSATATSVAIGH